MADNLEKDINLPAEQENEVPAADTAAADAEQTEMLMNFHAEGEAEEPIVLEGTVTGKKKERKQRPSLLKNKGKKPNQPPSSMEAKLRQLEYRKSQLVHTTAELSYKMKNMLADEIAAMKRKEKRRSAEIIGVFARHNFYANGFTPLEMRTTLEDLGPTYVKIGQIMSSRVDMLPESYCKELEKLRQNVKELDPEIARAVIEQETGKKIDEIYSEFRDKPIGSASIGQAHFGILKDGTKVVTKVQRPLIAEMMRKDFVLLKKLAGLVNIVNEGKEDEEQMVDLMSVIEELEKVTAEELDFRVEAENTRFFKENCIEDETKVTCPTVIDELTTERIFTMTFVDGCSISKKERLIEEGCDLNQLGYSIIENYVHQVLDVGTFHGDPHQGNIMVAHGVPYWIDFGMIGRINDADITCIQNLILGLLQGDMEAMANAVMAMGAASPKTDRAKLAEDLDNLIDKYMSITSAEQIDMAQLLGEITELAGNNHISLPGKYTMLVRSIATIEGVVVQLCPEINLFEMLSSKLMERAKASFDLTQSMLTIGKDALEMGKKTSRIPALAFDTLKNLTKGRTKINLEMTGYDELLKRAGETIKNVVLALFACVLFFGSCILSSANIEPKMPGGQPLIAAVAMVFSVALGVFTIRRMSKK